MTGLDTLLNAARTLCRADAASKKRIFEIAAERIAAAEPGLEENEVYTQLLAREKLGSTGLGEGLAIPHCRVAGCEQPLGCLLTLAAPVDFDAIDNQPVDVLFVLLVPEDATQEHLDLLALLARTFSSTEFCDRLRRARTNDGLYSAATEQAA